MIRTGLRPPLRGWAWLLALLLAAVLNVAAGSESTVQPPLASREYDPADLLHASAVLVDLPGTLSILDVQRLDAQGRFSPLKHLYGAGYSRGAFWLRLQLQADAATPADWWLQVHPPYLDDVRMSHVLPDGRLQPEQSDGDRAAHFSTVHRTPIFALQLAPGLNTVYLRVQSSSSISVLPSLVPAQRAASLWQRDYMGLGVYFGLEVALVLAAALGALMLRRRVYVYFAIFVTAGMVKRFALSGLAHQWWFADQAPLADAIASSSIGITAAAGAVFFAELFEYRRFHRRLYWVILASGAYMAVMALAPLYGQFHNFAGGAVLLTLLNYTLMSVPLLRLWRSGPTANRVGVLGFIAYVAMVMLNVVSLLGVIPPSPGLLQATKAASLLLLFMLLLVILHQTTRAHHDHRLAEETLANARAAEERERTAREEQSHLTSMLAHEIRTPVAVIDAALQSLQVLDDNATPERLLRHERIARAVQRMKTLMDLALEQDRLEISTWSHRLSAVDLVELTHEVLDSLGPMAQERVLMAPPGPVCVVQADERMLRFALLNLIDNALKYSPDSEPVEIAVGPLESSGVAGCLWSIVDNGPGIAQADHERVFQKFFRAAGTTAAPGLGLGLHIVRQTIHRHHGHVCALPGAGGTGTRFECWLPLDPQSETKEPAP